MKERIEAGAKTYERAIDQTGPAAGGKVDEIVPTGGRRRRFGAAREMCDPSRRGSDNPAGEIDHGRDNGGYPNQVDRITEIARAELIDHGQTGPILAEMQREGTRGKDDGERHG
ncbi:MAG: hypothetical protein WBF47_03780 [Xanthobacteraceae bacterium]